MQVVTISDSAQFLLANSVDNISGNSGLDFGGGGDGPARSRSFDEASSDDDIW